MFAKLFVYGLLHVSVTDLVHTNRIENPRGLS